jgi:hypothetical protein
LKKGFKVREMEYYRVNNRDGNTRSPSPNIQQIGYKLLSVLDFEGKGKR